MQGYEEHPHQNTYPEQLFWGSCFSGFPSSTEISSQQLIELGLGVAGKIKTTLEPLCPLWDPYLQG